MGRKTRILGFSVAPEIAEEYEQLAQLQRKSKSELFRRMVETYAYPECRMVVTSRIVGYTGAARLGGDFTTTTIRDFTLTDVEQFLSHWHSMVAIGQMGPGESAENFAAAS